MNEKTRNRIGDATLLLGLVLFLLGAGLVITGYPLDATIAAIGALALIFVGAGSSIKRSGRSPSN